MNAIARLYIPCLDPVLGVCPFVVCSESNKDSDADFDKKIILAQEFCSRGEKHTHLGHWRES